MGGTVLWSGSMLWTVDPDDSLEEVDELNSTYIPIQIQ
jgi:hypothetical protein